jgi:hypothetical protein
VPSRSPCKQWCWVLLCPWVRERRAPPFSLRLPSCLRDSPGCYGLRRPTPPRTTPAAVLVRAIERGSSVIVVGCRVLVLGSVVVIVMLVVKVLSRAQSSPRSHSRCRCRCRWALVLVVVIVGTSSHHPPCEQLTGVGGGCRVVRHRCGVLGRVLGWSSSMWGPCFFLSS